MRRGKRTVPPSTRGTPKRRQNTPNVAVVAEGDALRSALQLAREIAAFPQQCLRNDRLSARRQHGAPTLRDALAQEFALGRATLASGEAEGGARRFVGGAGKHGRFESR